MCSDIYLDGQSRGIGGKVMYAGASRTYEMTGVSTSNVTEKPFMFSPLELTGLILLFLSPCNTDHHRRRWRLPSTRDHRRTRRCQSSYLICNARPIGKLEWKLYPYRQDPRKVEEGYRTQNRVCCSCSLILLCSTVVNQGWEKRFKRYQAMYRPYAMVPSLLLSSSIVP